MKKTKKHIFFILPLFAILLSVFCYSGYQIFQIKHEAQTSQSVVEKLISEGVTVNESEPEKLIDVYESSIEPQEFDTTPISVDFSVLQKQCPDIVAWLYCEDTVINYPIVQASDNDYYLKRLTNGSYNAHGTLFLDYRCNGNFTDKNSVVFGHNMKDQSMFGSLVNYNKQSFYEDHPVMYLFTPDTSYKIVLVAGSIIKLGDPIYDILPDDQFDQEVFPNIIKASTFTADKNEPKGMQYITLSTCSYEFTDARYVVLGELHRLITKPTD